MTSNRVGGDRTHALLSNARRRFALYYLLSNEYTNTDSLSLQIAAWEEEVSIADVSEDTQQAVKLSLHHHHLPKLAASNVLEFDYRTGDIVLADGFEDLRPFIEDYREKEEALDDADSGRRPMCP